MVGKSIFKKQNQVFANLSKASVFIVLLQTVFISNLSAEFKVDAELRNRSEFRDGYAKLAADDATPAFLISKRTRLIFCYLSENLKIKLRRRIFVFAATTVLLPLPGITHTKCSKTANFNILCTCNLQLHQPSLKTN